MNYSFFSSWFKIAESSIFGWWILVAGIFGIVLQVTFIIWRRFSAKGARVSEKRLTIVPETVFVFLLLLPIVIQAIAFHFPFYTYYSNAIGHPTVLRAYAQSLQPYSIYILLAHLYFIEGTLALIFFVHSFDIRLRSRQKRAGLTLAAKGFVIALGMIALGFIGWAVADYALAIIDINSKLLPGVDRCVIFKSGFARAELRLRYALIAWVTISFILIGSISFIYSKYYAKYNFFSNRTYNTAIVLMIVFSSINIGIGISVRYPLASGKKGEAGCCSRRGIECEKRAGNRIATPMPETPKHLKKAREKYKYLKLDLFKKDTKGKGTKKNAR